MTDRFVVLGVAPVRREWFRRVARWANEAALPVEFIKCISISEVVSRLESGRPFSALLADASTSGLDRDVLDLANAVGCSPIIVDHGLVDRDWRELGARAVVPDRFDAGELRTLLDEVAMPIGRAAAPADDVFVDEDDMIVDAGRVIAITGAGGLGTSTVAMALTQGLAIGPTNKPLLLADMALRSSQAMLHDARDVVPGLTELIESHRLGVPNAADASASIHTFPERGYDLLLGLRHQRDWVSIAPRALSATWTTLTHRYAVTICDITGDFDGADETGSDDIEDRNRLARTAALRADLVGVVGVPGAWGIHHLVRTILALGELGIGSNRIVPIINLAPRQPKSRAALTTAVADLLRSRIANAEQLAPPIFAPVRRNLEATIRDGDALPGAIAGPLASTFSTLLERTEPSHHSGTADDGAVAVTPGSLGTWSDDG